MPLGADKHAHTYRHCRQKQFQETSSHAPVKGQHATGLKNYDFKCITSLGLKLHTILWKVNLAFIHTDITRIFKN